MTAQPPATAPPGTPGNPLQLTDPRMMRALAHPARIAILQHLALEGPSTATECAEVAGLSPSACSYHLRTLARYGLVEEDEASAVDGRYRPWRARVISFSLPAESALPGAARAAGRLLLKNIDARRDEIRARYRDREGEYPALWQEAAGEIQDVLHLTAGELATLRGQLLDLLASYRRLDRAERPPGAHRVHAVLELLPWFDPEDAR